MKIYHGNCLDILEKMPSDSIDCIVTSPPYYALRDYGNPYQIGLEPTHFDYLVHLIAVFDEVKRVLKKEGTCWVNMGDTYGGSGKGYGDLRLDPKFGKGRSRTIAPKNTRNKMAGGVPRHTEGKSLLQIPSRFAIMMTERGWILRNEIIWQKPNAMPQSVKDRFTVDFEKLFFFTKSKKYHFEQQYEPLAQSTIQDPRTQKENYTRKRKERAYPGARQQGSGMLKPSHKNGRNMRSVWNISTKPFKDAHFAVFPEALCRTPILSGCPKGGTVLDPFMGSGTTLHVAQQEGRRGIGIELNEEYIKIARKRIGTQTKLV